MSEQLDFKEAVAKVAQECVETGSPASRLVSDDRLSELSPDALRTMAVRGWIAEVNYLMHRDRVVPTTVAEEIPGGSTRTPTHPAAGRNPRAAWDPLDRITILGSDGSLKSLAAFTRSDAENLLNTAEAQIKGWSRRRVWAQRAADLLTKDGRASTVGQLKKPQVEELSKLAAEAWS